MSVITESAGFNDLTDTHLRLGEIFFCRRNAAGLQMRHERITGDGLEHVREIIGTQMVFRCQPSQGIVLFAVFRKATLDQPHDLRALRLLCREKGRVLSVKGDEQLLQQKVRSKKKLSPN